MLTVEIVFDFGDISIIYSFRYLTFDFGEQSLTKLLPFHTFYLTSFPIL